MWSCALFFFSLLFPHKSHWRTTTKTTPICTVRGEFPNQRDIRPSRPPPDRSLNRLQLHRRMLQVAKPCSIFFFFPQIFKLLVANGLRPAPAMKWNSRLNTKWKLLEMSGSYWSAFKSPTSIRSERQHHWSAASVLASHPERLGSKKKEEKWTPPPTRHHKMLLTSLQPQGRRLHSHHAVVPHKVTWARLCIVICDGRYVVLQLMWDQMASMFSFCFLLFFFAKPRLLFYIIVN